MSPSICLSPLDRSETLRYLGMTEAAADDAFLSRLDACEAKLLRHATPRYTYCILPLTRTESVLYADTLLLEGNDIRQHLEGCDRAVLMAATLGTAVDVLIDRTQKRDMTNALLLDALANTAIEQVCDKAEQQIQATMPNRYFTWRFSPGYGDWPIQQQTEILQLAGGSQIGISLTESLMLMPRKSITAVIGLYYPDAVPNCNGSARNSVIEAAASAKKHDCRHCSKLDCPARASE